MRLVRLAVIAVVVAACFVAVVPKDAGAEGDGWEFTVAPYLWMAGIKGDVAIRNQKADVDESFSDILENLDLAVMLHTEARKGRWGFFVEPNYISLSADEKFGPRNAIKVEVDIDEWIVEFGGFYRAALFGGGRSYVDVLLGGRYWNISTDMDVKVPILGIAVDRSSDVDFVDPFIGARFRTYLTDSVGVSLRGDIGGFGISDSMSDFTWQVTGFLSYDISKRATVMAGYRALGFDYGEDDLDLDLTMYGPAVGFAYRF